MVVRYREWWDGLCVQHKVWTVVLVLSVPLIAALAVHLTLIHQLRDVQKRQQQAILARDQIHHFQRLAVDIEDAFRGYLLTEQDAFLKPMREAEAKLAPTVAEALALAGGLPGYQADVRVASEQLSGLLESKHALIEKVRTGRSKEVVQYVRSGKGLTLSNALRRDSRALEDRLARQIQALDADEAKIARQAYWGLLLAVVGGFGLGFFSARLLTASITTPLTVLQGSVARLGAEGETRETVVLPINSSDEIGQLARAYEKMAHRIQWHIRELEFINAIGAEINTIGPDGLDGLLWRITNRAAEVLQVDVCIVMLRNERMGCWVVEAASGEWHEKLHKSVVLWEEFPVSVRAFESGQPAFGENLRSDLRPEIVRRNLIGDSMLSIPLLSRGVPFGVLVFLQERKGQKGGWNIRVAKALADEAAIAISNARLYEEAKQKGKGLELRLKQLEHLAEMLAHDMKAPGERMQGLASLLLSKYEGKLDNDVVRLLALIEENGRLLTERIETILALARVGSRHEAVEAVDPALVIADVLKARAGELEAKKVRVHVDRALPLVPCHRAYLRQIFDNLISNAIKFSRDRHDPEIRIMAQVKDDRLHFSVSDNGCGIPEQHRSRVFEPFARLSPSVAKGSGIGLTIVKRIVELYGGKVWVEPQGPPGCTITLTLPVLCDLFPARPSSGEENLASMPGRSPTHGRLQT